jgi:beta-glucosidase
MIPKRLQSLALIFVVASSAFSQQQDTVEKLLAQMTLEEKLGQLTQLTQDQPEFKDLASRGLVGSILNSGTAAQSNEIQRRIMASNRLKIPLLIGHDVIHGYRTIFPIPLAIAATWDPQLGELASRIAAREARSSGIHWTFAPMVDIARDPRWGRMAEGAGEDQFLGSAMAAAYVRGFQGGGLLACAKHYAAYGAAEGGRDYAAVELSEATLREVYLAPFKAAVDADVASFMSAFNTINRVPATANQVLLQDILRDEWKFNGFVVSDWSAVAELIPHGIAADKEEAARRAIRAGVDLDMVDTAYLTLAVAVREGRLPEAVVDQAVRRMLRAKQRAGLFENPLTDERQAASLILSKEHRDAARRVGQRAIVLLKNDRNLLPLPRSGKTIAVIGALADEKIEMLGPWSSEGKAEEVVSILEGLRSAMAPATLRHHKGTGISEGSDQDISRAVELASESDVVIAVLGESREMSGEAASRTSIDLPGRQQELLEKLVATGKPVVLVLQAGRPLSVPWAAEHVPAIVHAWFLGSESGNAIADVIFGSVNPSGKLPVTVPRNVGQSPMYYSQLPTGRPPKGADKYTSKYIDVAIPPLYPFGHGLSYTRFEYSDLSVSSPSMRSNGQVTVSANVRNAGSRAGEETVQLYVHDPVASVSRPLKELKGFRKISLAPGETRRVEFTINREALQFWMNGGWVAEPGKFRFWIAPDSVSGLEGTFDLVAQ